MLHFPTETATAVWLTRITDYFTKEAKKNWEKKKPKRFWSLFRLKQEQHKMTLGAHGALVSNLTKDQQKSKRYVSDLDAAKKQANRLTRIISGSKVWEPWYISIH